jgi:hypothetical protein
LIIECSGWTSGVAAGDVGITVDRLMLELVVEA